MKNGAFAMGKMSDKEKENIILKAVEAIQESINQIQVNSRVGQVCPSWKVSC